MAQRGGGGGGFSPGAGAGRGDAPAPGTGVGGGFAGGGGGLWAGDEHAEQSWGDKALRWLDDNLFRPAGYLAEKYAGGAGKQAETLWNGMVTWGRAGAAGELQQDQLAAQQFAFLGGPWETHAQETEKANTAVTQALPQAAQGLRGDAMRDYAEGIDGRYGDPDGLLGWLGERADSAGQGLLSGAARILGVPGAGTAMDFLSTMENAAQQARENGAGEDEAFLYGLGEVVKRIGGQQLEEYFRSKAGELFTRGEVQAMSPREISENYDAIRESMSLWDKDGRLPEDEQGQPDAPTRPDEQMQPNAPELENAGETVYDEINLPNDVSEELVDSLYVEAWRCGCKGCTVYRDGSRSGVLIATDKKKKKEDCNCMQPPVIVSTRPRELDADVVKFQNNREKWIAFVGLLNGRPYEIFTGLADDDEGIMLPKNVSKGTIIKSYDEDGNKHYDFQFKNKRGYKMTIEGLDGKFNPEYWNYAKLISGVLRYGMPIDQVIKLVQGMELNSESINTWKNGVERALKKYLPNGMEAKGQKCPNCGLETLIYQEGCLICTNCGASKCG